MKLFKKIAGMCMFLTLGLASCKEEVEIKNSLSVSPDTALEFNATDNESVTLTVTTDADKWTYQAPEWIKAEQSGNTLVVNVEDNTGDARNGSISFTAGTADEVKINVLQNSADGEVPEDGKSAGTFKDETGENQAKITFTPEETSATVKMKLTFTPALKADANVSVFVDEAYVEEYNTINGTSCVLLPNKNTGDAIEWPVNVTSGSSEAEVSIELTDTELDASSKYLLPLKVKVVSGDVTFSNKESRVNYLVSKVVPKEIKQMCIMEFNDANPLSVLEYKLADGRYFFDALVLFSGNMGWDAGTNSVRFNARTNEPVINKNTDALVREWQTYIKPIHDAGIKVYMGIMPHHTQAGIKTLSYDGCKWFAEEMAEIIKDCQMDGVFLDEEYVGNDGGAMTPEWSTPVANEYGAGAYFAYQMKKQMAAVCPWPTEVAVYTYSLGWGWKTVIDHEDQSEHTVAEYADIMVADYGDKASPEGDQTLKQCTGSSIELNRGYGNMDADKARQIKADGYGWMMWFAFNPDPNHSLYNKNRALPMFKEAAIGCYDVELVEPTHYYKKIGEGMYDSERYAY